MSLTKTWYALTIIVTLLFGTGMKSIALAPKEQVMAEVLYAPVDLELTGVKWRRCSSWNGFYYWDNHIELCENNLSLGVPAARFILLHEMGHAFTFTRGFNYDRWGGNYEAAADEFAAVHSIVRGHPEDLLAMAAVFESLGDYVDPSDPRPTGVDRGRRLRVLYASFHGEGVIQAPWQDALTFWMDKILEDMEEGRTWVN